MAIQAFNRKNTPAPQEVDPRRTMRAPFPSRAEHGGDLERFTQRARDEIPSGGPLAPDRRTIARCPACGESVRGGDDYVRHRGDLCHARCGLYRDADDGGDHGDGPRR